MAHKVVAQLRNLPDVIEFPRKPGGAPLAFQHHCNCVNIRTFLYFFQPAPGASTIADTPLFQCHSLSNEANMEIQPYLFFDGRCEER